MLCQTRSDGIQIIDDETEVIQADGAVVHRRTVGCVRRALEECQVAAVIPDMGGRGTVAGRSLPTDVQPQQIAVQIDRALQIGHGEIDVFKKPGEAPIFERYSIAKIPIPRDVIISMAPEVRRTVGLFG